MMRERLNDRGVTIVEYAMVTAILVLGLLVALLLLERAMVNRVNEGRNTYAEWDLRDPT